MPLPMAALFSVKMQLVSAGLLSYEWYMPPPSDPTLLPMNVQLVSVGLPAKL